MNGIASTASLSHDAWREAYDKRRQAERTVQQTLAKSVGVTDFPQKKRDPLSRIDDEKLRRVVERLRNASLPSDKKAQLLQMIWNIARSTAAAASKETMSAPFLNEKTMGQLLQMIADSELREAYRPAQGAAKKDDNHFDEKLEKLIDEDDRTIAQSKLFAETADAMRTTQETPTVDLTA